MTKMALELLPTKLKWDSDLSDRALYYPPPELQDGTVMFVDDIEWTNTLGVSVKKTITNYQEGSTSTIVKELESEVLHTRKKLSFWMTSVDNQADDQIRDRLFAHSLPSNKEDATRIINQMKKMDQGRGLIRNREATLTCKIIVELLSEKFNQVLIPFDDEIIFTGDPRAYRMFSDIVKGLVAFQALSVGRGPVDGVLTATKKDLEYAAKIYNGLGGHDPDKFSIAEQKVIDAITARPCNEANRQQIIEATGLSGSRVDAVIYGRGKDLQKKNGLIDKCGLSTRTYDGRKIFCLDIKTLGRRVSRVSLEWAIPEYIKPEFVVPEEFKEPQPKIF